MSDVEIESKTWHYMVLTLDPIDRGVYQSADGTLPRHRLGSVYVDGTVVLTFETRLPLMNDATMTVGADYHSGSLRRCVPSSAAYSLFATRRRRRRQLARVPPPRVTNTMSHRLALVLAFCCRVGAELADGAAPACWSLAGFSPV